MTPRIRESRPAQDGVMLIEVMVALAIVAIALSALLFNLNTLSDSHQYIRDKSHARWIASNQLNLAYINHRYFEASNTKNHGTVSMLERDWHWRLSKKPLKGSKLQRWTLTVGLSKTGSASDTLVTLERLSLP
jgi:general secretion pathway protein I